MWIDHSLFTYSVDGHVSGFHSLATTINAAKNIRVLVSVKLFSFLLDLYPRSDNNSMFNISKNCHTIFQNSSTILHSYQQSERVPIFPHPQYCHSSFLNYGRYEVCVVAVG